MPLHELKQRAAVATLMVASWSACQFDSKLPDTATFVCAVDGDCPPALVCRRSTGMCIEPPRLGTLTLLNTTLDYVPARANPRQAVVAANADTQVQVQLTFDQTVRCGQLVAAPDLVPFATLGGTADGTTCRYVGLPVRSPTGEWTCSMEVTVTDGMDEVHTFVLAPNQDLRVDTKPPARPDVDTDGRVVYVRAPFGTLAGPGPNTVTGAAGSVESDSLVQVLVGGLEVQRAAADATGAFGPLSVGQDPERVELVAIDAAGNASVSASVRDVEWVATHDQRAVDSSRGNPHRVLTRRAQTSSRVQSFEVEVGGADGVGRPDGTLLEAVGGAGLWFKRGQELPVDGGTRLTTATDTRRGRVLAVGGSPMATWAWEGSDWVKVVDGPQQVGNTFATAYDPLRDVVVMWAGLYGTWQFDGQSAWSNVVTDVTPDVLNQFHLAFDATLGEVVLVGGGTYSGIFFPQPFSPNTSAWSFNGKRWRKLTAAAPFAGRENESAVYDPVHREHVFFGSLGGETRVWSPVVSGVRSDAGPPTSVAQCLVWDDVEQRVLALGRRAGLDEVWAWDGTSWALHFQGDGGLLGSSTSACAFDTARDQVVVGGGVGRNDTRAYRNRRLETLVAQSIDAPLSGQVAWGDDRMLVLRSDGGLNAWLDGVWTDVPVTGAPSVGGLTSDYGHHRAVAYEPSGSAFWGFQQGAWSMLTTLPEPTLQLVWWVDHSANALVLDTPTYAAMAADGGWSTIRDAGSGTFNAFAASAYSPAHATQVRFQSVQTERWNADGTWTLLDGGRQVPASTSAGVRALVTDPDDQRLFLVTNSGNPGGQLTVLDVNGWSSVETLNKNPTLIQFAAAWDHHDRRLWVQERVFRPALWELRLGELRPAIVSHFVVPPLATVTLSSMRLSAIAGGTGGARARIWHRSRWDTLAADGGSSNSNAADAPGPLSLTVTDPTVMRELLEGEPELTTALESVRENGADAGVVSADAIELRLRYKFPQ